MAKSTNNSSRSKAKTPSTKKKVQSSKHAKHDNKAISEMVTFCLGMLMLVVAVFIFLSEVSLIVNGKLDQSIIEASLPEGEIVSNWTLTANGKAVASGTVLGIKRIRVLNNPVSGNCKVIAFRGMRQVSVRASFYAVDSELVRIVNEATTESGETDTAKWMTSAASF